MLAADQRDVISKSVAVATKKPSPMIAFLLRHIGYGLWPLDMQSRGSTEQLNRVGNPFEGRHPTEALYGYSQLHIKKKSMSVEIFDGLLSRVLAHEGGDVNDPRDRAERN